MSGEQRSVAAVIFISFLILTACGGSGSGSGGENVGPVPSTQLTPPQAPSHLTLTIQSTTQITLYWVDNAGNEDRFEIERSLDGVLYSPLKTVTANITTFSDSALLPDSLYHYRVRAFNAAGFSVYCNPASAYTQTVSWAKSYGGPFEEQLESATTTEDGGYIMAGTTQSFGVGFEDFWLVKVDAKGEVQWEKVYGGADSEVARSIAQTTDGGYIVAGTTFSFGMGLVDIWVLKLNPAGEIEWQKAYGGSDYESVSRLLPIEDGYLLAGNTASFGSGTQQIWVIKLQADGEAAWQKILDGTGMQIAGELVQTPDGGYIIAGSTSTQVPSESSYSLLVKLDSNGDLLWQKVGSHAGYSNVQEIVPLQEGGYLVAGYVAEPIPRLVASLMKVNEGGNIQWQKNYGDFSGASYAVMRTLQPTPDGGFLVGGSFRFGSPSDLWLLKVDEAGTVQWQNLIDSTHGPDSAMCLLTAANDMYALFGFKASLAAEYENWLLMLPPDGSINFQQSSEVQVRAATLETKSYQPSTTSSNFSLEDTTVVPVITNAIAQPTTCTVEQQAP